uniref:Peptidase M14 domain-containing protein n=2 Tax=Octopus bimaculoides TaxID=37653 RepID=A0A0L8GH54_OCTBM
MSMDMTNVSIIHSDNPYDNFMRKHLQYYGYYKEDCNNVEKKNKQYKKQDDEEEEEEEEMEENIVNSHRETVEARRVESLQLTDDNSFNNASNTSTLFNKFKNGIQGTTQLISTQAEGKMILKLQEPRDLHFMSQLLGAQSEARWPRGLEIKTSHIRHLCIVPVNPEPFYQQTGLEDMPGVRSNLKANKVVFENKRMLNADALPCDPETSDFTNNYQNVTYLAATELQFESRFESGNLARAVRVGDNDYELYLHCDLYTRSHTQWFYFQVTNTRKNVPYRFTIVNLMKSTSLYNYGMKPLMYSEKSAVNHIHPVGWQRIGYNIKYYKSNLNSEDTSQRKSSYSLTWTFKFPYSYDTVYFAHSYPYTYSDLQEYLFKCANNPKISKFFNIRILCRTLAGNNIYILTITNPISDTAQMQTKKAVFVTCRVHPGESNASWVMKGFLDVLIADSEYSKLLREMFVFKVIPMLNPDGVIVGNYRCSLSGRDLNRNYKPTLEGQFPTIGNIISMVKK